MRLRSCVLRCLKDLFAVSLFLVGTLASPAFSQESPNDWKSIIGDDLDDWSDTAGWWRVQDGRIVAESEGGPSLPKVHYLVWDGSIGREFALSLEYRIVSTEPRDAGVNIWVERPIDSDAANLPSYQAELDTGIEHANDRWTRLGKLYGKIHDGKRGRMLERSLTTAIDADGKLTTQPLKNRFDPRQVYRSRGQWNRCEIRAVGDRIELRHNGTLANVIVDLDVAGQPNGDGLALQFRPTDASRFEVRELKYKSLTASEDEEASTTKMAQEPSVGESEGDADEIASAEDLARRGNYLGAIATFERVLKEDESALDSKKLFGLAVLYAATNQREKHKRFCRSFIQKMTPYETGADAERPAKAYLVLPGANDRELLRLCEERVDYALRVGKGGIKDWFSIARGMLDYRTGSENRARRNLGKLSNARQPHQRTLASSFAAMSAAKQGRRDEAIQYFMAAKKDLSDIEPDDPNWIDRAISQLAIAEAKQVIASRR